MAASMALFSTGVAGAANEYVGMTYAEAVAALTKAGLKPVVATRVGEALSQDQCVVTRSENTSRMAPASGKKQTFGMAKDTVLLFLDCAAPIASAGTPGNSAASPEGRAAIAAAAKKSGQG